MWRIASALRTKSGASSRPPALGDEPNPVELLQSFMSSIPSQLAILDDRGTILVTNDAWAQFAGPVGTLSERPREGENYLERLAAIDGHERESAQALLKATNRVLLGETRDFELEIAVEREGVEYRLLARAARFRGTHKTNLTITFRDITAIRRAEQKVRESEERFKFAIESTGGAVWDWHVPSGTVSSSAQLAKMLGLPRWDSLMSTPNAFRERLHPEDIERTFRRYEALIDGTDEQCALEHRLRHEDGTWHWVLTRCAVRERDGSRRALRILGVHADITDLKEAEASLRDERIRNRMLAKVAELTTNAVVILDANRCIIWANRSFTEVTGHMLEEARGRRLRDLLEGPETDDKVVDDIHARLTQGAAIRARTLNYRKDGQKFWLNVEIQPVRTADGTAENYVVIMEDLTEREKLEAERRLSQKLESVGQLAAGIAHEINTPIQYVGDSVTFLEEAWRDLAPVFNELGATSQSQSTEASRQHAATVDDIRFIVDNFPGAIARARDGVSRVASIVRAMKEFAHPDQGKYSVADLNHAIENALVVSRNELKYVGTASTVLAEIPQVSCRIGLINQVLLNLLVNAAHALADKGHTPDTGRIEVRTRLEDAHVVISIIDNGTGIADAHRERIFDPFFTTKEVGRGTGQGLAIARSIIVEQHGGKITVDSQVGEGSRFEVWLPIRCPAGADAPEEAA